jgi:RNA-directed DNA polymerase
MLCSQVCKRLQAVLTAVTLMRAVRRHTDCPWALLYLERWLRAPVSMPNGDLVDRESGTPQGAVVSPVLGNLFLHYAFDLWM